jgi:hypothetical protein
VSFLFNSWSMALWHSFLHLFLLVAGHPQKWSLSSTWAGHEGQVLGYFGLYLLTSSPTGKMRFKYFTSVDLCCFSLLRALPAELQSTLLNSSSLDAFVHQGYQSHQFVSLNETRLHLQAVTLADISLADGVSIDPYAWKGERPISRYLRTTDWIETRPPSRMQLSLWQRALRKTFLFPNQGHQRLRTPLGQWNTTTDTHWKW